MGTLFRHQLLARLGGCGIISLSLQLVLLEGFGWATEDIFLERFKSPKQRFEKSKIPSKMSEATAGPSFSVNSCRDAGEVGHRAWCSVFSLVTRGEQSCSPYVTEVTVGKDASKPRDFFLVGHSCFTMLC